MDTGSIRPLARGRAEAVHVADRLLAFTFESGARVFGGVDIAGHQFNTDAGDRIQFSPPLDERATGGPLLNSDGEVVALLGGASMQGAAHSGHPANVNNALLSTLIPRNSATPISALPQTSTGTNRSLESLAADGSFTQQLVTVPEFSYGGAAAFAPKNAGDAMPNDTQEFSKHDPRVGGKVYDSQGRLRVTFQPKKVSLTGNPMRVSLGFSPAGLNVGIYRIDVLWNNEAVWRTFVRIAE